MSTSVTASGQPIVLPQNNPTVRVPIYEIAPGAVPLEYKHIYLRYGYVLGTLRVTYTETGKSDVYGPGAFIVEAIGQWHQGANTGIHPVKLLVIDQAEKDQNNVVLRKYLRAPHQPSWMPSGRLCSLLSDDAVRSLRNEPETGIRI